MRDRILLLLCIVCICSGTESVFAEEINIRPQPALSSDQYSILSSYLESADGIVQGRGSKLRIVYASGIALNGYIAIMNADGMYNPADMYSFELPAQKAGSTILDVTALTTWTPFQHQYYLSFLSSASNTDTTFSEMTVLPATFFETVSAGFHHFLTIEPYWVSSAHLLRGYKVYGIAFSLIAGLGLTLCFLYVLSKKSFHNQKMLTGILLIGFLLYSLRFAVDLGILSVTHLYQWSASHTYAQTGDIYSVADAIKEAGTKEHPAVVSVCFSSTDYYAKLLRYLVYPIPVTMTGTLLPTTTHIVVTHQLQYSESGSVLHCDSIHHTVTKIHEYPDGTILYSVPHS